MKYRLLWQAVQPRSHFMRTSGSFFASRSVLTSVMYTILLPVDRDVDRAISQAEYVDRLTDVDGEYEVTVLHVSSLEAISDEDEEFSTVDSAVAAAAHLEEIGLDVTRSVESGRPAETISEVAANLDVDEIVMGGRKRSGMVQVLLGSTVYEVMISTEKPVTITGKEVTLGTGSYEVLVSVDRDVDRALDQARYVTTLPNAAAEVSATVLYVFPHLDYKGAPPHEFDEIDAAVQAADSLEDAGVSVERVAIGGEVVRKILETGDELDVDTIVMGGRKRSSVRKVLLGSTVRDVMLSADRPITLVG